MRTNKHTVRLTQLAQDILSLARQKAWPKGHHLTETGLAKALGVSRTPIRGALDLLNDRGVVSSRPNHGYFLNNPASELFDFEMKVPQSAEENLYMILIDLRLSGEIEISITQSELMNRLNAPRNLVERVLDRMSDEGLISRSKGRGWKFLPAFDNSWSWECGYQLRLVIEPDGILLPQFEIEHEQLTHSRIAHEDLLKNAGEKREGPEWIYKVDADFHELIAAFSNNAFFLQAIQHQNRLRRLLEFRGYINRRRITNWCKEHLAIIDSLQRGQLKNASKLMAEHLSMAKNSVIAKQS